MSFTGAALRITWPASVHIEDRIRAYAIFDGLSWKNGQMMRVTWAYRWTPKGTHGERHTWG